MQIIYSISGAHLMQPSELHKVGTIYSFAVCKSHKEVLVTFGCNGDVHWAELNNGLSTEWKAHPEDKVQGTR